MPRPSMIDELDKAVQLASVRSPGGNRAVDRAGETGRQRSAGTARCWTRIPATLRSAAPFRKSRTNCGSSARRRRPIGNCWPCSSRPRPTRPADGRANRLLDSQPALRRLKDGLVDAQLRTAALQGRMSAEHPEVISAKEAETQVAARVHAELPPRSAAWNPNWLSTPTAWKCWKTSGATRPPGWPAWPA